MAIRSVELPCQVCGTGVRVPPHRRETFRFCSRKCGWKAQFTADRIEKKCATCAKAFAVIKVREKTARYCSRPCYVAAMRGRGSVDMVCSVCGDGFKRSPSRVRYDSPCCSVACRSKLKRVPIASAGYHRSWLAKRGLLKKACERCVYAAVPAILVVHHRDRNHANNAIDNLETLCPNCHAIEHHRDRLRRRSL